MDNLNLERMSGYSHLRKPPLKQMYGSEHMYIDFISQEHVAYILYNHENRFVSLLDFEGHLMGLILQKEISANSGHYLSIIIICGIWNECDDVKTTRIEFNNFHNLNTVYMLFCR